MDSFELNKIIGAILGTLLFVMGVGFLADAIYAPKASGPGYALPEPEGAEGAAAAPVEVAQVDIGTLLASANVEQGQASARRCAGCHNFAEGAGNKAGPELFGVVGHPIASHAGFTYSEALKAHAGDTWNYDNLSHFLQAPAEFAPGTKMAFGGLKDDQERANVIAYLASISPNAPEFPAPAAAEPAAAGGDTGAPLGEAPAASDQEAVPTDADAIATPETTDSETPVEGTPTTSGPATSEPAAEAAPAGESAPATESTPAAGTQATQPPVTSPVPAQ